jgi:hypothetical protein
MIPKEVWGPTATEDKVAMQKSNQH